MTTSIDWEKSKKDALQKLKELPVYSRNDIIQDYQDLLVELGRDEIKDLDHRLKAFTLHQQFERFALSYTFLFNLAVKRNNPVSVDNVRDMLEIIEQQKQGLLSDEEARVKVMRLARPDL